MDTIISGFLYATGGTVAWRLINGLIDLMLHALGTRPLPTTH